MIKKIIDDTFYGGYTIMSKKCDFCGRTGYDAYDYNFYETNNNQIIVTINDPILDCELSICEECNNYYQGFGLNYFFASLDDRYQDFQKNYRNQFDNGIKLNLTTKNMMLCTTAGFEGYNIIDYKGIVSSCVVLGTGIFSELESQVKDMLGKNSKLFEQKIKDARQQAINRLKREAALIGANAVIGIATDIEVTTANMFVVNANGTGVVIEKSTITKWEVYITVVFNKSVGLVNNWVYRIDSIQKCAF